MPSVRLIMIALLLVASSWPAVSSAQVRRCSGSDGTTMYTDRRCQDVGGVELPPRDHSAPARMHYRGCARNLQDLVYEMTLAIDGGDPNRLASVYHWAGMSGRTGYSVMSRLDAIVQRPLVDIVPMMPASPDGIDGDYYPQTTVRQRPIGLRVEQTLSNGSTPSRTVFGLQRHFGCWWLKG